MMHWLWFVSRVGYALAAGLFLVVAGLQWNDADPWHWMVIYGLASGFCVIAAAGRFVPTIALTLFLAVILGYAGYLGVVYFGGYEATPMFRETLPANPSMFEIEEPREMIGLLIITAILATLYPWRALKNRREAHQPGE